MGRRTYLAVSAAVAVAIGGGAYAGGIARGSSPQGGSGGSGGSGAPLTTTPIVRTTLVATTQVGGSLGYAGSYTVLLPSGTSPQALRQAQQQVSQAQRALSDDQVSAGDDTAASNQQLSQADSALSTAETTQADDEYNESVACAGAGAASPACASDKQKVAQDQTQVTQATNAKASAELQATRNGHQDQAKLAGDTAALQTAEAALAQSEQNAAAGGSTFTWLPAVGTEITQGQPLCRIDGRPVPLLYGGVPAWRAFSAGMTDGTDVGELNADLIALGFGAGVTPGDHFSAATATALERWQTSLGLPATGELLLGAAIFESGPLRVTSVHPSVGQSVSPGPVLGATGTTPQVTVALDVNQEYGVKAGDAVTVVLPDGTTTVPGHITAVANVANAPSGSSSSPTVNVTISLDNPAAAGGLDEAPVNVNITTQTAPDVLAVPINALLALKEGGDAVEVVSGGIHRLVGVQTGLFSSTMVQISGGGITAGTEVEVPSQ